MKKWNRKRKERAEDAQHRRDVKDILRICCSNVGVRVIL